MTASIPVSRVDELPVNLADRRGNGWWGMVCFVGTEATLFSALIAGYLYVRLNAEQWPPPGVEPHELLLPSIGTAVLTLSSASLVLGERALRREQPRRGRALFALTTILGLVFLGIQYAEWQAKTFALSDHAYGTAFFTVTGAHGAHVAVGLVLLVLLQTRIWVHHERRRPWYGMHPVSLYWHFVDAVWIVVFCTLYLSERR